MYCGGRIGTGGNLEVSRREVALKRGVLAHPSWHHYRLYRFLVAFESDFHLLFSMAAAF